MGFKEEIASLAEKAKKEVQKSNVTEESTKAALIMPMFQALGQSYFSVLYQDNSRRPICRLWLDRNNRQLAIYDGTAKESGEKNFAYFQIQSLNDLYQYKDRLAATVKLFM